MACRPHLTQHPARRRDSRRAFAATRRRLASLPATTSSPNERDCHRRGQPLRRPKSQAIVRHKASTPTVVTIQPTAPLLALFVIGSETTARSASGCLGWDIRAGRQATAKAHKGGQVLECRLCVVHRSARRLRRSEGSSEVVREWAIRRRQAARDVVAVSAIRRR